MRKSSKPARPARPLGVAGGLRTDGWLLGSPAIFGSQAVSPTHALERAPADHTGPLGVPRGRRRGHPSGCSSAARSSRSSDRRQPALGTSFGMSRGRGRKVPTVAPGVLRIARTQRTVTRTGNGTEDRRRREARLATSGGNPLQALPKPTGVTGTKQGRNGRRRNQSVKRSRKPEGAAQSGLESRRRSLPPASYVEGPPHPMKGMLTDAAARGGRGERSRTVVSEREDKGMRGCRAGFTSCTAPRKTERHVDQRLVRQGRDGPR